VAQGSRTTFAKRQKEQARKEKQRAKSEKRQQKKLEGGPGDGPPIEGMDIEGLDEPLDGPILPDWAIDDVPAPESLKTDKQK